ncbi:MAG: hypothetical protein U0936_18715 [Planctomycetaceae bacterium]
MLDRLLLAISFSYMLTFGSVTIGAESNLISAESVAESTVVELPSLCGEWSGEWCSQSTGHRGPMKATFCRLNCNQYEVTFMGRFCSLIPFRYKAVLTATPGENGQVVLTGSKNLGLLFGTFRFRGSATDCRIVANYCSKDDRGQFRMSRVSHH